MYTSGLLAAVGKFLWNPVSYVAITLYLVESFPKLKSVLILTVRVWWQLSEINLVTNIHIYLISRFKTPVWLKEKTLN